MGDRALGACEKVRAVCVSSLSKPDSSKSSYSKPDSYSMVLTPTGLLPLLLLHMLSDITPLAPAFVLATGFREDSTRAHTPPSHAHTPTTSWLLRKLKARRAR